MNWKTKTHQLIYVNAWQSQEIQIGRENKDACDDAISKELGVENWANVNFSKEPELNQKWDLLVEQCTGSEQVKTGVKEIDRNSELVKEIGTSYGYVWESINTEAQIYTTLAFDGLIPKILLKSLIFLENGMLSII